MMWLQKVTLLMLLLACVAITMAQKPTGTAVKVCPHGQPMNTSSNTPLACLTDEDCDATYRCVQRPKYTISKVCCPKVHRNGKKKNRGKPWQKREEKPPRWQ